jgi:cytochrome c biogenesis protein CcdA
MWIIVILLTLITVGVLLITEAGKKILENIALFVVGSSIIALFVGLFIFLITKAEIVESREDVIIGISAILVVIFFMIIKSFIEKNIQKTETKKLSSEEYKKTNRDSTEKINDYNHGDSVKKDLWYEKYTNHRFESDLVGLQKEKESNNIESVPKERKLPWYKNISRHNFKE